MIDLNQHRLSAFFAAVAAENDRSMAEHGGWDEMTPQEQIDAVKSECLEWEACSLKTGSKGVIREAEEAVHAANVMGKRWGQLRRLVVA